jgi:hypothetical protein
MDQKRFRKIPQYQNGMKISSRFSSCYMWTDSPAKLQAEKNLHKHQGGCQRT